MKILKNNKLVIIVMLITIFIGCFFINILFHSHSSIKTKLYKNEELTFKYDSSWHIASDDVNNIILSNSEKANLVIKLLDLEDEYKYSEIEDLSQDLLYTINNQNKNYKLISKKEDKITGNLYDGYKMLYENEDSQVMVVVAKNLSQLIVFIYESENEYFDILLDSVQSIIYNFKIAPVNFDLKNNITLNIEKIIYSNENNLNIQDEDNYEIANSNFLVNYSIPSIFKLTSFNSTMGFFSDDNDKINLITNIYNVNVFDYLDKNNSNGVYSNFDLIRNNSEEYKNFKEQLGDIEISGYKSYVYKVSYTGNQEYENYYLIIPIYKNRIFVARFQAINFKISENLIKSFKINSVKNYASYVNSFVNNKLYAELKRFIGYNYNEYNLLTLELPTSYREISKNDNIYTNRYFGNNYDKNNDTYQYEIRYRLSDCNSTLESEIDLIDSYNSYYQRNGSYKKLAYIGERVLNGKKFKIYDAGYSKIGLLYNSENEEILYYVYEKVLISELENGGYLIIVIDGNNVQINDQILNDVSIFNIENKKIN